MRSDQTAYLCNRRSSNWGDTTAYQEHEAFQKPDDENSKIWRYLDFTKFVSLLDRKALFFARADLLGDPFEGSYSKANLALRPTVYKDKIPETILANLSIVSREIRKFTIINSWNMSEFESAAMWKLYVASNEGVAIQSTFKRLAKCFDSYTENPVFIGMVKYIDYEREWLPEGNSFYPFMHKRKSFEHEHELRAIIQRIPTKKNGESLMMDLAQEIFKTGAYVAVNLDALVERIFVSPASPTWFSDLVKSIVTKYNLSKEVVHSSLDSSPVF